MKGLKLNMICAAVATSLGLVAVTAQASHFRGGAMIPTIEVNESGTILTVRSTTFWRKNTAESNSISVSGVGSISTGAMTSTTDTSDSRFDVRVDVGSLDISNVTPGTLLSLSSGSCCRVATGSSLGNWSQSSWNLDAAIQYDGGNANPITFDFATIQPEVSRIAGNDYAQNLNATSADGLTLTYNQALNLNINSQVPGFTVDPNTGLMTVVGDGNRAQITDNTSFNAGADAAFSGNIIASDGSFVEFDWMFDGVDEATNQAPTVDDAVINALVGDPVNHTFTATDPEDGSLLAPPGSWDPNLVLGAGFDFALPVFDPNTQQLTWDTTGYAAGQYLIQARAFDSDGVGDFGLLTVNLCDSPNDPPCGSAPPPPPGVPAPGTLALLGLGMLGLGWSRKKKN
jgi:hypothetical protein